jgi:hypothetical protein
MYVYVVYIKVYLEYMIVHPYLKSEMCLSKPRTSADSTAARKHEN